MKLYEFVNNNNNIEIVKRLIFFDEEWSFPNSKSSDEYISGIIGNEKIEEYKKISKIIVDELNKNLIEPHDFESSFKKIIKELFLT
jgi:hypothetical protein